jgi:hypothetical protein
MSTNNMFRSLTLALMVGTFFIGCSDSNPSSSSASNAAMSTPDVLDKAIAAIAPEEISPEERASLIFMREEEKVARDVYIAMYQRWGHRTFNNISRSEEVHMRAILILLNRYSIPDPVGNNGIGVFTDQNLQQLYNQLIARGNTSLTEALRVGVLIEEVDIRDLTIALTVVDNRDIILVYNNLLSGSQNHLRAFNRSLGNY